MGTVAIKTCVFTNINKSSDKIGEIEIFIQKYTINNFI